MHPEYFWWGGMWIFPLMMFTIMIIVLYLMFGRGGWRPPWYSDGTDTALEVLRKRYAQGEISREEFEQIKKDLES